MMPLLRIRFPGIIPGLMYILVIGLNLMIKLGLAIWQDIFKTSESVGCPEP